MIRFKKECMVLLRSLKMTAMGTWGNTSLTWLAITCHRLLDRWTGRGGCASNRFLLINSAYTKLFDYYLGCLKKWCQCLYFVFSCKRCYSNAKILADSWFYSIDVSFQFLIFTALSRFQKSKIKYTNDFTFERKSLTYHYLILKIVQGLKRRKNTSVHDWLSRTVMAKDGKGREILRDSGWTGRLGLFRLCFSKLPSWNLRSPDLAVVVSSSGNVMAPVLSAITCSTIESKGLQWFATQTAFCWTAALFEYFSFTKTPSMNPHTLNKYLNMWILCYIRWFTFLKIYCYSPFNRLVWHIKKHKIKLNEGKYSHYK